MQMNKSKLFIAGGIVKGIVKGLLKDLSSVVVN